MKLQKIVKKVLLEAYGKDKKAQIITKWKTENPDLNDDDALELIDWFDTNRGTFRLTKTVKLYNDDGRPILNSEGKPRTFEKTEPQIKKLLTIFPEFREERLNDIDAYSYRQLKFLYDEYNWRLAATDGEKAKTDLQSELSDTIFTPKVTKKINNVIRTEIDRNPSPTKNEASKQLWLSSDRAIINSNGVRVYKINSRQESINFGYYLRTLHESPYNLRGNTWCTTYYDIQANRYPGYRQNRSFYFIIDDNKNPERFKTTNGTYDFSQGRTMFNGNKEVYWYLCAFQVMEGSRPEKLTLKYSDIQNLGDISLSWDNLISVYPQLSNFKNNFLYSPMTKDELEEEVNILNNISETSGSHIFSRLSSKIQNLYLLHRSTPTDANPDPDDYPALTKAESWNSMDDQTQKQYIELTTANNFENRWFSFELLYEIFTKYPQTSRYIDNFFAGKGINKTIKQMLDKLIQKKLQFETYRVNAKNKNIEVWESLSDGKFCIYDKSQVKNPNIQNLFYTKNGIEYDNSYKFGGEDILIGDDGEVYLVESFIVGGPTDARNFYVVTEATGNYSQDKSYFFTQRGFEDFKRLKETGEEELNNDDDLTTPDQVDTTDTQTAQQPTNQNLVVKKSDIKEIVKRNLRK